MINNKRFWLKGNIRFIHFSYSDFQSFEVFSKRILEVLVIGECYSLLVKIRCNDDMYLMLGDQVGINLGDFDGNTLNNIHDSFLRMLENIVDIYNVNIINNIQLMFIVTKSLPKLNIKNFNKLPINKEFVKVKETKHRYKLIPPTLNTSYYGINIIDNCGEYLDIINKQRYLVGKDKVYINNIDSVYLFNKLIIINKNISNEIHREIYDSKTGILISSIIDVVIREDYFIRSIGDYSITIKNSEVVKVESNKQLSKIKYVFNNLKDEVNPFIGSWDIETFKDVDGYSRVYALGFTTLKGDLKTYYLEDGISSHHLVIKCINDMLKDKYNGFVFYTHNFGGYDSKFLRKILEDENVIKGYDYYILNSVSRDNKIIKLDIKISRVLSESLDKSFSRLFKYIKWCLNVNDLDRLDKHINNISTLNNRLIIDVNKAIDRIKGKDINYIKISIVDSYNLLSDKLDDLSKSFDIEVDKSKGKFPHTFVKRNTLNYIGVTPDLEY